MAQANFKCHKDYGYDYFYVDWDKKVWYSHSGWSGHCSDYHGEFSSEADLKVKIARYMGKVDEFFYNNPGKWNCEL